MIRMTYTSGEGGGIRGDGDGGNSGIITITEITADMEVMAATAVEDMAAAVMEAVVLA